jgi:hypothetical protein
MVYTAALNASLCSRDFPNFLTRFIYILNNGPAEARQAIVADIEAVVRDGAWHPHDNKVCMATLPVSGKILSFVRATFIA